MFQNEYAALEIFEHSNIMPLQQTAKTGKWRFISKYERAPVNLCYEDGTVEHSTRGFTVFALHGAFPQIHRIRVLEA